MKLTKEQALELHRQMWSDMQKALGDIICFYPGQIKVVAWMEFPSPYKGENNDNI